LEAIPHSYAMDRRAEMVMDAEGMTITYADASKERFSFDGSIGTGLNGQVYSITGHPEHVEPLFHTTILLDRNAGHEDEPEIYLFRDQVWWPCSHPMMQGRLLVDRQKSTGVKQDGSLDVNPDDEANGLSPMLDDQGQE
jgi:hypothetical protein